MIEFIVIIILALFVLFYLGIYINSIPLFFFNIILIIALYKKIKSDIKEEHVLALYVCSSLLVALLFIFHDSYTSILFKIIGFSGLIELAQFLILTFLISHLIRAVYTLIYRQSVK